MIIPKLIFELCQYQISILHENFKTHSIYPKCKSNTILNKISDNVISIVSSFGISFYIPRQHLI